MKKRMKRVIALIGVISCAGVASALAGVSVDNESVRQVRGDYHPLEHVGGQLRSGYILLDEKGNPDKSSFAVGGHLHIDTKRYKGIMAGATFYTIQDLGLSSSDPNKIDPDFFDAGLNSFSVLGEAFLDGKWGNTVFKGGRQVLDTPHADSDDIRMMPNLFSAYTITNTDLKGLTLSAGFIDRMAGWENEFDASKFINLGRVLGRKLGVARDKSTNGAYMLSASYDGIERLNLDFWAYKFTDFANDIYLEAGYSPDIDKEITLTFGLQYDRAVDTGDKLAGTIDANTWGVNVEAGFENVGLTIHGAYNQDSGDTGAFVSFGGGPYFTSLEDQTLDAIGGKGKAYIFGADYKVGLIKYGELTVGSVYGKFKADNSSDYDTREIDVNVNYSFKKYTLEAAYAMIDDRTVAQNDFNQFRLFLTYDF